MTPAPLYSPNKSLSNSSSGKFFQVIPARLIIFANSRVVITASTSFGISFLALSYFLAVHGMTETTKISFGSNSCCLAKYDLIIAPIIMCGDLHEETFGMTSG